jgi:hypothetical protein
VWQTSHSARAMTCSVRWTTFLKRIVPSADV